MTPVDIVAMLALLQYLVFGAQVGSARGKYGVKAPAVTGHEMFERAYRVQMPTLELLVMLLPALYVAARYWSPRYLERQHPAPEDGRNRERGGRDDDRERPRRP